MTVGVPVGRSPGFCGVAAGSWSWAGSPCHGGRLFDEGVWGDARVGDRPDVGGVVAWVCSRAGSPCHGGAGDSGVCIWVGVRGDVAAPWPGVAVADAVPPEMGLRRVLVGRVSAGRTSASGWVPESVVVGDEGGRSAFTAAEARGDGASSEVATAAVNCAEGAGCGRLSVRVMRANMLATAALRRGVQCSGTATDGGMRVMALAARLLMSWSKGDDWQAGRWAGRRAADSSSS